MRFTLELPSWRVDRPEDFVTGEAICSVARAAEEAGFGAVFESDHPFPPESWMQRGGHHTADPFVSLSFAAAVTSTLLLHTHLLVLPYRNPFVAAKSVASLDALSGGRVMLGVGAGYLEAEFGALGATFDGRNEMADEALAMMVAAWSGEPVTHTAADGTWRAAGNVMLPRPAQHPHPPVYVGGNSRRAIRRAVAHGTGWAPMPSPAAAARWLHTPGLESLDELAERIRWAGERCEEAHRPPLKVMFVVAGLDHFSRDPFDADRVQRQVAQLAELGVSWASVSLQARDRSELLDEIARFGDVVIRPLG